MTTTQQLLILLPISYLLGAVPYGLIIGLSKGVDPRKAGSGNIGATNIGRLLGKKFGLIVFALDMLKGLGPTLAASLIVARDISPADAGVQFLWLATGFASIFGHMFSIFIKFKGGKGVATSAGVVLGIWPYYTLAAAIVLVAWAITFKLTRIISLASMIAACLFPPAYVLTTLVFKQDLFGPHWPLLAFSVLTALMILFKHRSNIARLRAGTEHRFARKTDAPTPGK